MPPTVILIRHAQALHKDYSLHDPPLSTLGFGQQCDELAQKLQTSVPLAQEIELIVISPMRRTLQTAKQGLGWLMNRGIPVILRAEWQENSANPCDTGSEISVMRQEWPMFDWDVVDPVFPKKTGLYAHSKIGLTNRGIAAREWLRNRPEKVIAVVSHSGFLRVGVSYRQYENADFRIFSFADGEQEDGGRLVEWEITEKNGGGLGKSGKGVFAMGPGDYPLDKQDATKEEIGEVAREIPQ